MIKNLFLIVLLITALPVISREYTPEFYVKAYSSGATQSQSVNESLAWAGLSDPEIFDHIEQQILDSYLTERDKARVDYLAWLTKALSFSGNPKYQSTLTEISSNAKSKKLRRYAESALPVLSNYQHWNDIIAPDSGLGRPYPSTKERLANMLNSSDLELIRVAAKRMHIGHIWHEELLAIAAQLVEENYLNDGDKIFIDTTAWLCKALAGSKNQQYRSLIEDVSVSAANKKLRKYARKYLNYYRR